MEKPPEFQEEIFAHLFEITDKSRFDDEALDKYEQSEAEYISMQNALDYAVRTSKAEGKQELIATMLANGISWDVITKGTGITPEAFERMKPQPK